MPASQMFATTPVLAPPFFMLRGSLNPVKYEPNKGLFQSNIQRPRLSVPFPLVLGALPHSHQAVLITGVIVFYGSDKTL